MKIKLLFLSLVLLTTGRGLFAQTTTVTGTITDANGNPYANGTASAYVVVASGQPAAQPTTVPTNVSGLFTFSGLASPASYQFTICAPPTVIGPRANPTPRQVCFTSGPITISGGSQDISATLNAIAVELGPNITGVSVVVSAGTSGQLAVYAANGNVVSGASPACPANQVMVQVGATAGCASLTTAFLPTSGSWGFAGTFSGSPIFGAGFALPLGQTATVNGTVNSNNLAAGNVANKNFTGDATLYISGSGNDSNDGLSWGTAKLTLAGALSALPNCARNGIKGNTGGSAACGEINVGSGIFTVTTGSSITSPYVSLHGRGPLATQFNYTGTGCFIDQNIGSVFASAQYKSGSFSDFSIDGTGNANANACGFKTENLSGGTTLRNVTISNFTASGDSCLFLSTGTNFNERSNFDNVWLGNCTTGWLVQNVSGTNTTLGYGFFNLWINVTTNQTAAAFIGNGVSSPLQLEYSLFHVIVNLDGNAGEKCASLTNYARIDLNSGVWECDGGLAGQGFNIDANSWFTMNGAVVLNGPTNSITAGGKFWTLRVGTPGGTFPLDLIMEGASIFFNDPGSVGNLTFNWPGISGTLTDAVASGTTSVTAGNAVGCVDQIATATGATTAMKVLVSPVSPQTNTQWSGYVSSAGNVDIHVCTIVALTGSAVTYNWGVIP